MQLRVRSRVSLVAVALAFFAVALSAQAQREDRHASSSELPAVAKKHKPPQAEPRAVAVLEWVPTAAEAKKPVPVLITANTKLDLKAVPAATAIAPTKEDIPKQARLIPVSIFYQGAYQDAGVYLSQPTPLALQADTVYELEKAGDPAGTFTLHSTSRTQDAWIAFGEYKPVPPLKAVIPNVNIALGPNSEDDEDSDRPVLLRRHPTSGTSSTPSTGALSASTKKQDSSDTAPIGADDADRPTMKQKPAAPPPTASAAPNPSPAPKQSEAALDPKTSDNYLNPEDDASRPRIKKGVYREHNASLPTLFGNPANLRQTVAVSDAVHTDDHPFAHLWNDDAERLHAKQAMQDLALKQIAAWQKTLPPTVPSSATRTASHHGATRRGTVHKTKTIAAPLSLVDVQFAGFDLAYQDEPTYIFAGQTADAGQSQIFVAVVARPDIYGNLQVVFSAVTNGEELALTPRYRLVDAVDASGDGRAELLLEARNLDGRRFVLLDVYRGQAQKVFETGLLP